MHERYSSITYNFPMQVTTLSAKYVSQICLERPLPISHLRDCDIPRQLCDFQAVKKSMTLKSMGKMFRTTKCGSRLMENAVGLKKIICRAPLICLSIQPIQLFTHCFSSATFLR